MNNPHKNHLENRFLSILKDMQHIIANEFKTMFQDRGVVIMLVLAPLAYPLLYCSLYKNETLTKVPVAAVNLSNSMESRELIRHIDATQNICIAERAGSLAEAEKAFHEKKVHGVVYIPADFNDKLIRGEQAHVSIYCDMSSFMYYRIINQACSNCILAMNENIKIERLNKNGITGESASNITNPIPYTGTALYNEGGGFASFLIPAILMIIIQQTLFLGIGMIAGTSREENRFHMLVSSSVHRGSTIRVIIGKSLCYLTMYAVWSFFILGVVVDIFNLPHIGFTSDIINMMIPYLLAVIFFSMTISVFMPHRETAMVLFLSFSLILLFLSGVSWPQSNINGFWKVFAWIFPSTLGVQAYIKINTMGTTLREIRVEYVSLWIQTALYFVTTCWAYRWQIKKSSSQQAHMQHAESMASDTGISST